MGISYGHAGLCAAAIGLLLGGCAQRDAPYRFRSPLLSGVHAHDLNQRTERPEQPRRNAPGSQRVRARNQHRAKRKPARPLVLTSIPSRPLKQWSSGDLVSALRSTVGRRVEDATDLTFAFTLLKEVGVNLKGFKNVESGQQLVTRAKARGAFQPETSPLLGDLVLFDRVKGAKPASLVGIVVSADNQGTTEFVYLARGIVRRGYVNSKQPSEKRDRAGRALNTHVRHFSRGDRRNTKYLAGELFAGYLRLDRLSR